MHFLLVFFYIFNQTSSRNILQYGRQWTVICIMIKSKCKHPIVNHIKNKNTFSYPYSNTLLWFNESTAGLFVVQVLQRVNAELACCTGNIDGCLEGAFILVEWSRQFGCWHGIQSILSLVITLIIMCQKRPTSPCTWLEGVFPSSLLNDADFMTTCHVILSVKLGQCEPKLTSKSHTAKGQLHLVHYHSFDAVTIFFFTEHSFQSHSDQASADCSSVSLTSGGWYTAAGLCLQIQRGAVSNLCTWHSSSNFIKYSNLLCLR